MEGLVLGQFVVKQVLQASSSSQTMAELCSYFHVVRPWCMHTLHRFCLE